MCIRDRAYIACGRMDAFFELKLMPWDIAAGTLIVREAGGIATDFLGDHDLLFKDRAQYAIGKIILVGNIRVQVIGVLKSKGSSMNSSGDRVVLLPLIQAKQYYASPNENYDIAVKVNQVTELDNAVNDATGQMRLARRLRIDEPVSYTHL